MINPIFLGSIAADGKVVAQTTPTVELYTYQETEPYYDTKVGDFSSAGDGMYYIELTYSIKGTVLVNGVVKPVYTGKIFMGDDLPWLYSEF